MKKEIQKAVKAELKLRFKLCILELAEAHGKNKKVFEKFDVSKTTFYSWKRKYKKYGKEGLIGRKPIDYNHPSKISQEVIDKILKIRKEFRLGPIRIMWYLERYHGIIVSESSVYRILRRNGVSRLPKNASRRDIHTKRYSKSVPGQHVQIDVKFLIFRDATGKTIRRFQYTAIDDTTRIRALKVYKKHTQANAIDFAEYVFEKFPFRIHTVRTDRGHEFQAKFHWLVEDIGIRHVYIKPNSPQLNGKVERSHRTDKDEFYQLLSYTDDVDLNKKLQAWEQFYNFERPHMAFNGKTPYETLKHLLEN